MYKINDEIFYLKIDEQVEYLTQVVNEIDEELKATSTDLTTRVAALEEKAKEFDEKFIQVNDRIATLEETEKAHYNSLLTALNDQYTVLHDEIESLKKELEEEIALKQNINDDNLTTESKKVVGAINENKKNIDDNKTELDNKIDSMKTELESKIDLKQGKTDTALNTEDKTIVGAINEVKETADSNVTIDENTLIKNSENKIAVNKELTLGTVTSPGVEMSSFRMLDPQIIINDMEDDNSPNYQNPFFAITGPYANRKDYFSNVIGITECGNSPESFAMYMYASKGDLRGHGNNTGYVVPEQVVYIDSKNEYSPFLTFDLIKQMFMPINYVMTSTSSTVPVIWGTWEQIGYTTINNVKIYYYKRTA